jgi:hypothetical protein
MESQLIGRYAYEKRLRESTLLGYEFRAGNTFGGVPYPNTNIAATEIAVVLVP